MLRLPGLTIVKGTYDAHCEDRLTLATLGYNLVPAIADFDKTHATNPSGLPHARYHVVWQVMSDVCMPLIALFERSRVGGEPISLCRCQWTSATTLKANSSRTQP